eukprot:gene12862-3576_t
MSGSIVASRWATGSGLSMWRAEATEVAQAASKWKQRSLLLQSQVDSKERELTEQCEELREVDSKESELTEQCEELREVRTRNSRTEGDCNKQADLIQSLEARCGMMQAEVTSLRSQLQDAISAQQSLSRRSDSAQHELAQRDAQLDKLTCRLADEQSKGTRLRQDELDSKSRMLTELTIAVQKEERGRVASQQEAATLRDHLLSLEKELRHAQTALASVFGPKLRRESSYAAVELELNINNANHLVSLPMPQTALASVCGPKLRRESSYAAVELELNINNANHLDSLPMPQAALASVCDAKLRRESSYAAAEVALQQAAAQARRFRKKNVGAETTETTAPIVQMVPGKNRRTAAETTETTAPLIWIAAGNRPSQEQTVVAD